MNELPVINGRVTCTDGKIREIEYCKMCRHSRWFKINGIEEPSPALSCCLIKRVSKSVPVEKAQSVGCTESFGDGFSSVTNILS